jgi:hypothetical protein
MRARAENVALRVDNERLRRIEDQARDSVLGADNAGNLDELALQITLLRAVLEANPRPESDT